jgi:hypothetical protein
MDLATHLFDTASSLTRLRLVETPSVQERVDLKVSIIDNVRQRLELFAELVQCVRFHDDKQRLSADHAEKIVNAVLALARGRGL